MKPSQKLIIGLMCVGVTGCISRAQTPPTSTPAPLVASTERPTVSAAPQATENAAAEVLVDKTFAGSNWEYANFLLPSATGGYLIAGIEQAGRWCFVMKVDARGELEWRRTMRDDANDLLASHCSDPRQTPDGGYAVVVNLREYDSMSQPHSRGILIEKLDDEGQLVWQKRYEDGWQTTFANVHAFGGTPGILLDSIGDMDVIKIDDRGNILATQAYGFRTTVSVLPTSDGGYIVLGNDTEARGGDEINARLIKADANGRTDWEQLFLVDRGLFERQGPMRHAYGSEGHVLAQTPEGGFLVAGYLWQNAADKRYLFWEVELNGQGAIVRQTTSDLATFGEVMIRTSDGRYLLGGERGAISAELIGEGEAASFVAELDEEGAQAWLRTFEGETPLQLTALAEGSDAMLAALGFSGEHSDDPDVWLVLLDRGNAN